jgi:uracil phosphoribosyltransferase
MTPYFAKMSPLRQLAARENIAAKSTSPAKPAAATPAAATPAVAVPAPPPPPVRNMHLLEHPLAQHSLTTLRNKDTPSYQYRVTCNQLLVLLLIEATRALPIRERAVETGTGAATGHALTKPVIFLTVARHGLGLAHNMADLFPNLLVGMISLDRSAEGKAVEPRLHIANAPALGDASVILFDPVVASGASAQAAITLVRRSGATDISLVSFLFSLPGLSRMQSSFPNLRVWTAGIDPELDPKRGPLPGMGNFAERLYG